jgi:hypothetical protein
MIDWLHRLGHKRFHFYGERFQFECFIEEIVFLKDFKFCDEISVLCLHELYTKKDAVEMISISSRTIAADEVYSVQKQFKFLATLYFASQSTHSFKSKSKRIAISIIKSNNQNVVIGCFELDVLLFVEYMQGLSIPSLFEFRDAEGSSVARLRCNVAQRSLGVNSGFFIALFANPPDTTLPPRQGPPKNYCPDRNTSSLDLYGSREQGLVLRDSEKSETPAAPSAERARQRTLHRGFLSGDANVVVASSDGNKIAATAATSANSEFATVAVGEEGGEDRQNESDSTGGLSTSFFFDDKYTTRGMSLNCGGYDDIYRPNSTKISGESELSK